MSDAARASGVRSAYVILLLGGVTSFATTIVAGTGSSATIFALYAAPLAILVFSVAALATLVRGGPASLGSAATPLAFALALYFGFGSLLPVIGPQEYLDFEQGLFAYSRAQHLAALRVVAVGTIALTFTALVVLRTARFQDPVVGRAVDSGYLRRAAVRMLVAGTVVRILITTPHALGLKSGFMSGSIGGFEMFAYVGLIMLGYGVASGKLTTSADRVLFAVFGATNLALGLISLSKLNFFLSVAAIMGGIVFGRADRRTLFVMAAVGALSYGIVQPFVNVGRALRKDTGASIVERVGRLPTAALIAESLDNEYAKWFALSRFNYTSSIVFAIESYDGGRASKSMTDHIGWVMVPRFLWPNKPNITATGHEVAVLMTGNEDTLTGIGIFGEGYWNGGYLGVILAAAWVGLILAFLEGARRRALELFDVPCLFLFWYSCWLAFRIDDFFLPTYVGSWPIIFGTFVILAVVMGRAPNERFPAITDAAPNSAPSATSNTALA